MAKTKLNKKARKNYGHKKHTKSSNPRARTWSVIQQIITAHKADVIRSWTTVNSYTDKDVIKAMNNISSKFSKVKSIPDKYKFIYTIAHKYYIPLVHHNHNFHAFNDYDYIWDITNLQERGYLIGLHMVIRLEYFYFRDTLAKETKKDKNTKGTHGQTNIRPLPICFITHCFDKYSKTSPQVKNGDAAVGETKPAHNHWVIKFPKRIYATKVAKWIGVQPNYCQTKMNKNAYGWDNLLAYLIHAKSPKKHQYDPRDVWSDDKIINYQKYFQTHAREWRKGSLAKQAKEEQTYSKQNAPIMVMEIHHCDIHPNDIFTKSNNCNGKHYEITYSYHQQSMNDAFQFQQQKIGRESSDALSHHKFRKIAIYIWGKSDVGKTTFDKQLSRKLRSRLNWDLPFQCQGSPHPFDDYSNQEVVRDEEAGSGDGIKGRTLKAILERSDVAPVTARYFNRMMTAHTFLFTGTSPFPIYLKYLPNKHHDPLDQYSRRFDYIIHLIKGDDDKRYAMISHLVELPSEDPLRIDLGETYYEEGTGKVNVKTPFLYAHYPFQEYEPGLINDDITDNYIPENEALNKLTDIIVKANDPSIKHKPETHPKMTLGEYTGDEKDDKDDKVDMKKLFGDDADLPF